MVLNQDIGLDRVFRALSDPTRRAMLASLKSGEQSIGQLSAPFSMSFPAASKHVRVLETAGLVRRRVEGRAHLCRIEAVPLASAEAWLRFYADLWTEQLAGLDALLKSENAATAARQPTDTPNAPKGPRR